MSEIKNNVKDYINNTKYVVLGTVKNNIPVTRTLGSFANDGFIVYFSTNKNTEKVKHIGKNPHVSLLFQHEGQELGSFKNVSITGRATQLLEKNEQDKAITVLGDRNPRFKERTAKGDIKDTALFRVEPVEVKFLDFSKGIGPDSVQVIAV
jgi:nitroimidazol reductase NimA-like FMN-containing flavoprotein (pyridoxamine 5'-phosphate oxidase superfamily)